MSAYNLSAVCPQSIKRHDNGVVSPQKALSSLFSMVSFINLLVTVIASVSAVAAAPTIYLAGDSTMTAKGNNDGTAGEHV